MGGKNNLRVDLFGSHLIGPSCLIERMNVLQVGVNSLGILEAFLHLLPACWDALKRSAVQISVIHELLFFFLPSL